LPALTLPPGAGIIDFHAHISGVNAGPLYREVARAFGVCRVYSMGTLDAARVVQKELADFVRFIAFPNFRTSDRYAAFTSGFLEDIRRFHGEFGSRLIKLWNAPRLREIVPVEHHAEVIEFDSPWRVKAVELAQSLGMGVMVHIADPDTWFKTKYADATKFGEKRRHYDSFERMMDRYKGPWIAAHMGGFPEDLDFLSGLLERHPNLSIDTSATKWVVREVSKHPAEKARQFFIKHRTRILFGSDLVTTDEQLMPPPQEKNATRSPMADLASSPASARDLYASRYYALRLMLETGYLGESPIADPDLKMVEPAKYNDLSAPTLQGLALPGDVLADLYWNNAKRVMREAGEE
jgi:Amidohydrolase